VAILAAVMLLGTGVPQPDVFAQGGSVWVDPPPLESTGKPASPTTPEVRTPAGAKASIPPVAESTTPEARAPAGPKASIIDVPTLGSAMTRAECGNAPSRRDSFT